jgi:radical SAM protein with 4Fe4S-binding SPASM domain
MPALLSSLERPFIANLEVTSQCNLACTFCSAQLAKFRRDDLPTDLILQVIARIAEDGVRSIFLTGGEPLLRQDIPLIIRECVSRGMDVSLSTNGTEASSELAASLAAAGLEELQVSIHAPDSTHDRLVGCTGALDRGLAGLQNLVGAGLVVTVAAVATRANYPRLPRLAERVARLGAKHFRVLRLMPHSPEMLRQVVPHRQMQALVKRLARIGQGSAGLSVDVHAPPGFLDPLSHDPGEYAILHPLCHTCTAGKLSMGIMSNGDCVPCLELKDPEFACGNTLRDSLTTIWDARPMSLLRRATPDRYCGKCGKCELRWTCYSARCVAHHLRGDILGDDDSCYRLS